MLSRDEYEDYLIQINDINTLNINYVYKNMFFGKVKSYETEVETYDLLGSYKDIYSADGSFYEDYEIDTDIEMKLKLECLMNICVPLSNMYNIYINEIIRSNIHGIKDVLNELSIMTETVSKTDYMLAIKKTGELLNRMLETATTIPDVLKEKNYITALEICENNKKEAEQLNQLLLEKTSKKETRIKNNSKEKLNNFLEKVEIRKDILDIYDQKDCKTKED